MTDYTIRPTHIGGKTVSLNHNSFGEEFKLLHEVANAFADNVGLMVVNAETGTDDRGLKFIAFTIGTGKKFFAFRTQC